MSILKKASHFANKQGFTNQGFARYFKNTSWLVGEKIFRMTISLFVGVWVARYLGPEQFGMLSYAQSVVLLFSVFSSLGLDGIVVRELVKEGSKRNQLLGTAFALKLFGALFALILIILSILFQGGGDQTVVLVLIIASATIFQSFNIIDFYFQSKVLSRYVVFSNFISLSFASVLKVGFIVFKAPLILFACVSLIESFLLAISFVMFFNRKVGGILNWSFNKALAKSLLVDSWPLILSSFVVSIYMKVDQIMINAFLDAKAVGYYAAAIRLSEAWYFIPVVITASFFPAIINAKNRGGKLYIKRFQQLNDFMVLLALCIAVPTTFLGAWAVQLLYGNEYARSAGVLVIHIWSGIFVFMAVSSGKFLTAENMTKKIFYRNFLGLIINLILNMIFIPVYGIEGAAICTLASWFAAGYMYDLFDRELRYIFIIKSKSFNFFRLCSLIRKVDSR